MPIMARSQNTSAGFELCIPSGVVISVPGIVRALVSVKNVLARYTSSKIYM